MERLGALLNAAAAALETDAPIEAERAARSARALARDLRHAHAECGAAWLQRAAAYRRGAPLGPRPGLIDAARRVSAVRAAQHAITEAAIAWRIAHTEAAALARRAGDLFGTLGHTDGLALALGLCVAAGADVAPAQVAEHAAQARDPTLALQAVALGAPDHARDLPVRAWADAWHLGTPRSRADVLSLEECLRRLAR